MSVFPKQMKFFLKATISTLFILWLIYAVEWNEVLNIIKNVRPEYVVLYVVLLVFGIAISSYKWQIIARYKGFQRSFFGCFQTYLTGTFINNFLPSFIGGDTYRTYWLGKIRETYTSAVSTVVFDRISGLISAMLLAVVFSFANFSRMSESSIWTTCIVVIGAALFFSIVWLFIWKKLLSFDIVKLLLGFLPRKVQTFLGEVSNYMHAEIGWSVLGLSLLFNVVGVGFANLILFKAFGYSIPVTDFFAIIFLVNIISSIPVSVNNIGIKEWAYYTFFGLIAIDPSVAVTVALSSRFIQMFVSFFALPDFLRRKNIQG